MADLSVEDLVEAAARAIGNGVDARGLEGAPWEQLSSFDRLQYTEDAKNALTAIAEKLGTSPEKLVAYKPVFAFNYSPGWFVGATDEIRLCHREIDRLRSLETALRARLSKAEEAGAALIEQIRAFDRSGPIADERVAVYCAENIAMLEAALTRLKEKGQNDG